MPPQNHSIHVSLTLTVRFCLQNLLRQLDSALVRYHSLDEKLKTASL